MSTDIAPRLVKIPGGVVSYLEAGQGTPLVLLHGIGSGACSWRRQLDALGRVCRVIAWDAPGYGQSTTLPMEAPDASDYAKALDAFLAAIGVDRLHLLGHSLGTPMAARFAAERPNRILSLTLASVSSGHAQMSQEERDRLRRGRLDDLLALGPQGMAEKRGPNLLSADATDEMKRAVIETMAAIRPHGYTQAVYMLGGADTRADIARLPSAMRVQILFGDQDKVTTPDSNRESAAIRPQAPVYVIQGAGHAVYIEKPDAFNERLRDFIASGERG